MLPDTVRLTPDLACSRIVHGLWQVADMEKDGTTLDPAKAAAAMAGIAERGFTAFDMADHYGSAEIIAGRFRRDHDPDGAVKLFTKWCPEPGYLSASDIRDGAQRSFDRMGLESIDLLQFHWWRYQHPAYLDCLAELARLKEQGRIKALGLTNFDTDHLHVALAQGIPISTNQVCYSLLDRRAGGRMAALCQAQGVQLLCYGVLAGGFLSDRWLGAPEPTEIADYSKSKYKRFIDQTGGWAAFQTLLRAIRRVADRHEATLSQIAVRWVLDQPAVGAAIVGVRLGETDHSAETARILEIALTDDDRAELDKGAAAMTPLAGDCGDEYRKPPFLTASGDLSDHLDGLASPFTAVADSRGRLRVRSGSPWEDIAGYCRALRVGDRITVSGTTATHTDGSTVAPGDQTAQAIYVLDKIDAAIEALGGGLEHVTRTRVFVTDIDQWEGVARAHGRVFGDHSPTNTLVEVSGLVGDFQVEIEAEATID
ncbi:MAG: aldo/keto reductase [Alphaproteobacteria bacterium]|nr:aldo/keto reductase [Alphaproteobacteria bacterium]